MGVACVACSGPATDGTVGLGDVTGCEIGAPLVGAAYDIAKSRFAFGSTPTEDDANGFVRWVGVDGVVAIQQSGGELGLLNATAPEATLPDWNGDQIALASHVTAYFAGFGVSSCQVATANVHSGSGGQTIALVRSVDGINVVESLAYARFDNQDQSTSEGLYWPAIPADAVAYARAFRDILADPSQLTAYKAKLPADAQGDGVVNLHHTSSSATSPFAAAATYDVEPSAGTGDLGFGATLSFDAEGNPVSATW